MKCKSEKESEYRMYIHQVTRNTTPNTSAECVNKQLFADTLTINTYKVITQQCLQLPQLVKKNPVI